MSTMPSSAALAVIEPAFTEAEKLALAGFLAGYSGVTREAYTLDLRQFTAWCHRHHLALFGARRADIELFARDLEAAGRARATITRRLSTVAGLYRYAVEENLLDHSPAVLVRRPQIDYESHAAGLDRNEVGALLVTAGLGTAAEHALVSLLALNGLRVSEATGADIEALGTERGHRTLAIIRKGGKKACFMLRLPVKENVTLAGVILQVPPARRRAGIGSELLAHSVGRARRAGRGRMGGEARDGSPEAAFAQAAGAQAGIVEVNRILDIDSSLPARLDRLRAEAQAKSAGYSLLSWFGATPDEHLAGIARLNNAMTDAPRDEGVQATKWDGPRVAEQEEHALAHGLRFRTAAARHDGTGELAAPTQICTDDGTPGWAFQQITAVSKEHRGHRLGLLVKVANLEQLTSGDPRSGAF